MWTKNLRIIYIYYILNVICCIIDVGAAKSGSKVKKSQSSKEALCRSEVIQIENIKYVWETKYNDDLTLFAASTKNICLNTTNNNLVIRKCDTITGKWLPPAELIDCVNKQKRYNIYCPEDLTEIAFDDHYICLKLSATAQAYDESFCYGADTLFGEKSMDEDETKAILKYIAEQTNATNRFWLPVQRANYNKYYNPFVVRLPGKRWGDIYEMPLQVQELFAADKNCVAVNMSPSGQNSAKLRLEMTNCNEMLSAVCVFRKNFVAYSGCPQGFGALSHQPNVCYGIEWQAGLFPYELKSLTVADYVRQRNSLQHIFDSIDLESKWYFSIGNYSDDSNDKLYAIEMNVKEKFNLVPFKNRHCALSSEILTDHSRKNVEMTLKINTDAAGLTLIIYNRNYIWRFDDEDNFGVKCFTNAGNKHWQTVKIKMAWQNELETKALFEVKLEDYDGYYWCEAHSIFDFSLIKTERVVYRHTQQAHNFAFLYDIPCGNMDCFNIYANWKRLSKKTADLFKDLKKVKLLRRQLDSVSFENVRLMDIAAVDYVSNTIRGLIHITAALDNKRLTSSEEQSSYEDQSDNVVYQNERAHVMDWLRDLINYKNGESAKTLKNTEFCLPEAYDTAKNMPNEWQLTKYGQTATTNKLCLQANGAPVIRKCQGDFLWGAYWENLTTMKSGCNDVPATSNTITNKLQELDTKKLASKKSLEKTVKNVRYLLENNMHNLIPADLYYTARIMQSTMKSVFKKSYDLTIQDTNNEASTNIVRIYNCLMDINKNIIKPAVALNSTNILLEVFERLVDKMALSSDVQQQQQLQQSLYVMRNNNNNSILSAQNSNTMSANIAAEAAYKRRKHSQLFSIPDDTTALDTIAYEDIGAIVKIATNFLIFIIDPTVANVTGIALYRKLDKQQSNEIVGVEDDDDDEEDYIPLRGDFSKDYFQFLMSNQSVDDLFYESNLQLATYVPDTLLQRLDEISKETNQTMEMRPSTRIVIKVYANDLLFQVQENSDEENLTKKILTGRIVSISIPGHDKDLPEMLPLLFGVSNALTTENVTAPDCSYWNYDSWASDGLTYLGRSELNNGIILCGCSHLTPFAYLIGDSYRLSVDSVVVITETHVAVLDVITLLGCSLSCFGILGIFVTALTFQSWRSKASSKILLQLSAAISLQMVLFCFVNTEENSLHLLKQHIFSSCIMIGALLHYSVLVQFSWMLIIGYLQFKRYVQVFESSRPKCFFKKLSIIGWGAPTLPIIFVLVFDYQSYIPESDSASSDGHSICYPSGYSLYFSIIMPITAIIAANLFIFIIIVYSILRSPAGALRHMERGLALSQLRLSILLFFLLGFTWIFGLLATLKAGTIFSYLFCLTATLQGFVLFVYFVILDPKTRRMWQGFFYKGCGLKETYDSTSFTKETTQTLR